MVISRRLAGAGATISLVFLPMALGSCGPVTVTSAGGSAAQPPAVSAPPANSIEQLRRRALRAPGGPLVTCPSEPNQMQLNVVLATGLAPGKPPTGPNYGYGDGPVYLSGQDTFYPGGWDLALWLVKPPYKGPLLIRGRQVNGGVAAAFSQQQDEYGNPTGSPPGRPVSTVVDYGARVPFYSELDLAASASSPDWAAYFSDTHFDAPGCYLMQVDGTSFSETILLQIPAQARPPA